MTKVPLHMLMLSPLNVRTESNEAADAELLASIADKGIIEPLIVHEIEDEHRYGVLCGGRRLRCLIRLAENYGESHAPAAVDFNNIPIIERSGTDEELREVSATENIQRLDLRPHEEYAAFVGFSGSTDPLAVAARFGKPVRYVKQRLRLGRLHPEVFAALVSGALDVEQAEAYAATDDQDVQLRVFRQNEANSYHSIPSIRREIKGASAAYDVQRKLLFVGKEAYVAAGGTIIEDLFSNEGDIVTDLDILNTVFDARYQEEVETTRAGLAKKFGVEVGIASDYGQTGSSVFPKPDEPTPEQEAELQRLYLRQGEIEQLLFAECEEDVLEEGEADKLRSELADVQAGIRTIEEAIPLRLEEGVTRVLFVPDYRGSTIQVSGLFLPADLPDEQVQAVDERVPLVPPVNSTPPVEKPTITKRAIEDLSAARRQVLINFLDDNDPEIHGLATRLLVFALARGAYGYNTPAGFDTIRLGAGPKPRFTNEAWFNEPIEEVAFAMFCAGDDAEIEAVSQQVLGRMIAPHLETPPGILQGFGQAYLDNAKIRARGYWQPSAGFFDLFNKGQLADFVAPLDEDQASTMRRMKLVDAKARALAFFTGEVGGMSDETRAKALAWVPKWALFHVEQLAVQAAEPAEPETHEDVKRREPKRPVEGDDAAVVDAYEDWQRDMERTYPPARKAGNGHDARVPRRRRREPRAAAKARAASLQAGC